MAKTLYADGNTGKVAIFTGANDVVNSPLNRPQDIFFHSDFAYLKRIDSGSSIINLPYRTATGSTYTYFDVSYVIVQHNLGYTPVCLLSIGTDIFPQWSVSDRPTGGTRNVSIIYEPNRILLREKGWLYNTDLPSRSYNFNYFLGVVF